LGNGGKHQDEAEKRQTKTPEAKTSKPATQPDFDRLVKEGGTIQKETSEDLNGKRSASGSLHGTSARHA